MRDPLDRTAAIWSFVSYALAVGMLWRSIACILRNPVRDTPFEAVADLSPPFLIVGSVLIIAGHMLEHRSGGWLVLAVVGHGLGCMFTWNFLVTLMIGALVFNTTSAISGEPFFMVGLAHLLRLAFCGRRAARWIQRSSPRS